MFTSFSTALSALNAHSTAIDVVGNNLANMNTPGFKSNVIAFYDLVTHSLGAGLGETQVGFGVARPNTIRQFTQGAIKSSSGDLDVAIQGDGFLVVKDSRDALQYTRGGNLMVDKAGNLLTFTGQHVLGWMESNGSLSTNGPISEIVIPVGSLRAPTATTAFSFDMNLNAAAQSGVATDAFSQSIEVFDSLGTSHVVKVDFTKNATTNVWDYSVSFPDADVNSPVTPVTGSLTFNSTGELIDPPAGTNPSITIPGLKSGAADMTITWELYSGSTPRLTQFSQPSAVAANQQNGSATAHLIRVGVGTGGVILAHYTNGTQAPVGQLAMASIRNPESLIAVGNNSYQLSARSALPAIGVPGTGGRGNVVGGAVESSTVDIAREFTNLIVLQRGYQANTRVITTVDEMSQETINIKR